MNRRTPITLIARALLFSVVILLAGNAQAGPKEDAQAALAKFDATVGAGNPDAIVALFAPNPQFWGSRSTEWATTPAAIKVYFVEALKTVRQVRTHDANVVVLSDSAVRVAAMLEITRTQDGQTVKSENAHSSVWVKQGDRWLVELLHVSPRPSP